jgi:hypothetical protein
MRLATGGVKISLIMISFRCWFHCPNWVLEKAFRRTWSCLGVQEQSRARRHVSKRGKADFILGCAGNKLNILKSAGKRKIRQAV